MKPLSLLPIAFVLVALVASAGCIQNMQPTSGACWGMNGEIKPTAEYCSGACDVHSGWDHMQAHYDELCECCKSKGYSTSGEYKPKVYVMNPDGSNGEDVTCAYYPNSTGC